LLELGRLEVIILVSMMLKLQERLEHKRGNFKEATTVTMLLQSEK
jgi:hypothetical protein